MVSIVVPVWNREKLVTRCLDSLFAQTVRPLKVIVVDNNSTDGTRKVVRDWIEAHKSEGFSAKLLSETKPGAAAARNRGLAAVDTEHVIFFDSDDEMHPRLVEEASLAIGDADLVYWKGEIHPLDGKAYYTPFHQDNLLRRQFYNSVLSTVLYMARTEFVRSVGGWDERALVWDDWELGIRIALRDPKAVALPKSLLTIHAQKESITGTRFSEKPGEWERTLGLVESVVKESGRADTSLLLDMVDYRRAILAAHYRREGAKKHAEPLMRKALARKGRSAWRNVLLRLLAAYTRAGGRGAYYLWH